MTKQEFTTRTHVEVSNSEFDIINNFYMACECDKDEFCKMWCKMNANRVQSAKVKKRLAAKEEAYRDALRKFYDKTTGQDLCTPIHFVKMSVYEIQAISYAGIKVNKESGSGAKNLLDIRYEIGKYLGLF